MGESVIALVVEELTTLPEAMQRQVLADAQALKTSMPRGVSGQDLLRFAGLFPPEDLEEIREAIGRGCEQVHTSG
jgi:hypothetical protein